MNTYLENVIRQELRGDLFIIERIEETDTELRVIVAITDSGSFDGRIIYKLERFTYKIISSIVTPT